MKSLKLVLGTVRSKSPILFTIAMFHFIGALVCIGGLLIDERSLMGVNVWLKPLKFSISVGIYILTVGFLNTLYPFSNLKRNIINNIVSFTLLLEVGIICFQGARGVQSHYNESSLFDGILFGIMGLLIAINVLVMVFLAFETIRLKMKVPRPIQWAILMGWLVIIFGSWIGGQMISAMAHNVGIADGGAGLPFVNWSTEAGDLRVAHFFGLHAIQIIPLFALWVSNKWKINTTSKTVVTIIFGLLYFGWIAYTFYQAKQGMPFIGA
ncbi:MAG: hypothetical protein HKN48_04020 [Flavobacteriaceae bacterium]|nr:hypothetical protein [Flavobacteriaceae bacterium]